MVLSSNSTTTTQAVPERAVRALMNGGIDKAVRSVRLFGPGRPSMYAASKIAVSRWVRRQAVRPDWAGAGIRLNALAPGTVMTPLQEPSPISGRPNNALVGALVKRVAAAAR